MVTFDFGHLVLHLFGLEVNEMHIKTFRAKNKTNTILGKALPYF
jgi:hypothetical protein